MLRERTLFIVGAGASKEFGLPTGRDLGAQIEQALTIEADHFGRMHNGDAEIIQALLRECRVRGANDGAFVDACRRIRDALPHHNSIDNLIDNHADDPDVAFCGKLAIARLILQAEQASTLWIDDSNIYNDIEFRAVEKTWIATLFRMMQEGVPRTKASTFFENAAFVTFNYDRCIEHYFVRALRKAYRITEPDAARIVASADIRHVYGSLGALPWHHESKDGRLGFGNPNADLRMAASGIRTYSERSDDIERMGGLRDLVQASRVIVFLGFGYLSTNLQLISPHHESDPDLIIGSTYGLSEFNVNKVREDLRGWYSNKLLAHEGVILPQGSTAKSLLDDYGRALV